MKIGMQWAWDQILVGLMVRRLHVQVVLKRMDRSGWPTRPNVIDGYTDAHLLFPLNDVYVWGRVRPLAVVLVGSHLHLLEGMYFKTPE